MPSAGTVKAAGRNAGRTAASGRAKARKAGTVTVRLLNERGTLLGEQNLPGWFAPDSRHVLKIELEGENAVPRFTLTALGRS